MPKIVTPEETHRLFAAIAGHPGGIGLNALLNALQGSVSRRTLQRRLAGLIERRHLVVQGEGRALRYRLANAGHASFEPPTVEGLAEAYIPTSPEGEKHLVADVLRQPAVKRILLSAKTSRCLGATMWRMSWRGPISRAPEPTS
jgi:hypothetical protein